MRQGRNACGTTCTAAILRHYGVETTQEEVDREIRNAGIYTAPDLMMRYLRERGFEAVFRNGGDPDEICALVERGVPVVLLVDTDPSRPYRATRLHYVTAVSCRVKDGFHLGIYNPWGLREEITGEELTHFWDDVRIGPFSGWRRAYIAVAPEGAGLGAGRRRGALGVCLLGLAVADAMNGVFHLVRDKRIRAGLPKVFAAPFLAFSGLFVFVLEKLFERYTG